MEGCDTDPYSYINWDCAPYHKTMCSSITRIWNGLKSEILSNKEATKMVPFTQFVKKPHITKKGKHIMRLESNTSEVDAEYILKFIDKRLLKIIHHRNQLKNFRNTNYIQQFIWRCCYWYWFLRESTFEIWTPVYALDRCRNNCSFWDTKI